jgi:hypothetical protein
MNDIIFPEKLGVQPEIIRNAVEGLVNLLVESCRHQVMCVKFQHLLFFIHGFAYIFLNEIVVLF